MKRFLAIACLVLAPVAAVRSESSRITLAALGSEVLLQRSDLALSPDGKSIALVVARYDFVDNRTVNALTVLDVATGTQHMVAPGRLQARSPKWSPTGDRIAWLDSEKDGEPQLYVVPWDGHGHARARAVTHAARGVQDFSWNPDGGAFAFLTPDANEVPEDGNRHNGAFEVRTEHFLAKAAAVPSHVWIVPAAGGEARKVTSGPDSVLAFQWAGKGRVIVYLTQPELNLTTELSRVDRDGGAATVLVPRTARQPILALFPASPDGDVLAYLRSRGPEMGFRAEGVVVQAVSGGPARDVTAALDRSFGWQLVWRPDGRGVIATAGDGSRHRLWLQPLAGAAGMLDLGAVTDVGELSSSRDGALAFVGTEPQRPAEVYYKSSLDAPPRRLTDFNGHLAALELGRTETVTWRNDGMEHSGVVIYPPGFTEGKKYPLVLEIHGGPMYHYNQAFNPFHQFLAAHGWIVFCPDYRGGDSQGDAYRRAIINNTGDGPAGDIMAGVERLKSLGIVDPGRMAVSGWSYGGYLSAWLSARHHVWRSAVVGAAVTDWVDQYNLTDENVFFGYALGGSPWTGGNREGYRRQSPVHHSGHSGTPTLILANTGDPRVSVTQSYKWYHALKDNGIRVSFVAYPIDSHSILDPVQRHDMYQRWADWIGEGFRDASPHPAGRKR